MKEKAQQNLKPARQPEQQAPQLDLGGQRNRKAEPVDTEQGRGSVPALPPPGAPPSSVPKNLIDRLNLGDTG